MKNPPLDTLTPTTHMKKYIRNTFTFHDIIKIDVTDINTILYRDNNTYILYNTSPYDGKLTNNSATHATRDR